MQLNTTNGDIVNLFRVAVEEGADLAVRQQASIVFKLLVSSIGPRYSLPVHSVSAPCRRPDPSRSPLRVMQVRRRWEAVEGGGYPPLSDADKDMVRNNLLEGVIVTPAQISESRLPSAGPGSPPARGDLDSLPPFQAPSSPRLSA